MADKVNEVNEKDGLRVYQFSLRRPATVVPIFANFCGPEWSAGKRTSTIPLQELKEAPVHEIAVNGVLRESPVDAACKEHDIAYRRCCTSWLKRRN